MVEGDFVCGYLKVIVWDGSMFLNVDYIMMEVKYVLVYYGVDYMMVFDIVDFLWGDVDSLFVGVVDVLEVGLVVLLLDEVCKFG